MGEARPYDVLAAAMAELHGRFGLVLFDDRRRLVAFLSDKAPEARSEIRTIGTVAEERVHHALAGADRSLIAIEMDRLIERIEAETGMRRNVVRNAVRAMAHGLGLGPPPSVYEDAAGASPPPPSEPPAAPGGWAGLSEAVTPHAAPSPVPQPVLSQSPPVVPHKGAGGMGEKIKWMAAGVGGLFVLLVALALAFPEPEETAVPAGAGYADELTDFGVAAQSALQANVGSPTPLDIPGGMRITTDQLAAMTGDSGPVLIDVLADPHPQTLPGSHYDPNGGNPGTFDDANQRPFEARLNALTDGRKDAGIAFFCAGASCWESYNAALRAIHAGYAEVYWYRGGLASWSAADREMIPTPQPVSGP